MAKHPSSNDGDDGSGQRVWTKRWRALRHFALDMVADEKLMERGSRNVSKDRVFRKKVDDTGKNVDDQGASCLVGPSAPGMLRRVVPRPAVESVCESGSKGFCARYTNRPDASQKRTGNGDGAIASVGRGTDGCGICFGRDPSEDGTGVSVGRGAEDLGISCGSERRAMGGTSETRGDDGAGGSAGRGADDREISRGSERRAMGKASETRGGDGAGGSAEKARMTRESRVGANAERWCGEQQWSRSANVTYRGHVLSLGGDPRASRACVVLRDMRGVSSGDDDKFHESSRWRVESPRRFFGYSRLTGLTR